MSSVIEEKVRKSGLSRPTWDDMLGYGLYIFYI